MQYHLRPFAAGMANKDLLFSLLLCPARLQSNHCASAPATQDKRRRLMIGGDLKGYHKSSIKLPGAYLISVLINGVRVAREGGFLQKSTYKRGDC